MIAQCTSSNVCLFLCYHKMTSLKTFKQLVCNFSEKYRSSFCLWFMSQIFAKYSHWVSSMSSFKDVLLSLFIECTREIAHHLTLVLLVASQSVARLNIPLALYT